MRVVDPSIPARAHARAACIRNGSTGSSPNVDWLILQQREDGSFPRRWKPGSNEVAEPTGTTSYSPVPAARHDLRETGDPAYKLSAIRAQNSSGQTMEYRGLYVGGASDNPNITDKEAGMLSMEAFMESL